MIHSWLGDRGGKFKSAQIQTVKERGGNGKEEGGKKGKYGGGESVREGRIEW